LFSVADDRLQVLLVRREHAPEADAPANPNTPGTTRQDRASGAFARAAAEPASASTFDRRGRIAFVFPIELELGPVV